MRNIGTSNSANLRISLRTKIDFIVKLLASIDPVTNY